jgi:hypothetical protein
MDAQQFDRIAKSVGVSANRRGVLKAALVGIGAALCGSRTGVPAAIAKPSFASSVSRFLSCIRADLKQVDRTKAVFRVYASFHQVIDMKDRCGCRRFPLAHHAGQ